MTAAVHQSAVLHVTVVNGLLLCGVFIEAYKMHSAAFMKVVALARPTVLPVDICLCDLLHCVLMPGV
jgi:hypothetical protein